MYDLVSRRFACLCFCTEQQKFGFIIQDQKVIKRYGSGQRDFLIGFSLPYFRVCQSY